MIHMDDIKNKYKPGKLWVCCGAVIHETGPSERPIDRLYREAQENVQKEKGNNNYKSCI